MGDEPEPPEPAEQYFAERPRSRSSPRLLRFLYRGEVLRFTIDRGIFASAALDPGTALLIEALDPAPTARVLDLGCGWGAVGVAAARAAPQGSVLMTDVNRRAIYVARRNLRENKVGNAEVRAGSLYATVGEERFDLIATNPPYRAGRPLILELLRETPRHLAPEGRLLLVGKGSQGIIFYQHWVEENWPANVTVLRRGGGYRVLEVRPVETSRHQ
jgi:16S rRNA (guanine1207-N2)-methyltransferase